METTVTLAELARTTEDLPFEENDNDKNDGAPAALMTRPAEEHLPSAPCHLPPSADPSEADIATLTAQYRKAVNGLYEAYKFGEMLMAVRNVLTRENVSHVGRNSTGLGLQGWLAEHCPDINYKTALRFLSVAEKTNAALALQAQDGATGMSLPHTGGGDGLVMSAEGAPSSSSSFSPSEEAVKAFLEGKSQRQIIGGKRAGAGRPRKDWEAALGQSPEAAFKRLEEALAPLNELVVVKRTHRMLSEVDLETVRAAIDLLHERVHEEA